MEAAVLLDPSGLALAAGAVAVAAGAFYTLGGLGMKDNRPGEQSTLGEAPPTYRRITAMTPRTEAELEDMRIQRDKELDKNKTRADYEEMKKDMLTNYKELSPEQLEMAIELFELIDWDGSGLIDRSEMCQQSGGYDLGIFDEIDVNHDGDSNLEEFLGWFAQKFHRDRMQDESHEHEKAAAERAVNNALAKMLDTARQWAKTRKTKCKAQVPETVDDIPESIEL